MFDYLVIGKGLIGSAALRYLSQSSSNTAIIGPDEPAEVASHQGVFSSHYDQGRVTRRYSKDAVWAELANRAINTYALLEQQSGIRFHQPQGCLRVLSAADYQNMLSKLAEVRQRHEMPIEVYESMSELAVRFSYLSFPEDQVAFFEPSPAGYINPRELIRAQLAVARAQGASIFADTVVAVSYEADGVEVRTQDGRSVRTKKLLIATGAFANSLDVLKLKLKLRVKSETTLLAQVSAVQAERYQDMPAVLYGFMTPTINDGYLLPPIDYPDGKTYLKLGCNTASDQWPQDLAAMRQWIIAGDSDQQKASIQDMLESILPDLDAVRYETRRCLVTYTEHGYPYIDHVDERTVVAVGGNGSGAKSSDAIGQLAAQLAVNEGWQDTLTASHFQLSYA